ncbi:MAG: sigma-70 family RNA polymerase sigma factor [Ruminococcus sp.]|nr:sigma-70 family RNA polymerase sigma factor [Ruminococcus sp.]CDF02278.1 rNA polymerase sigma factor sigma-70 family [Ruminococcus sp. CAG:624]MCI6888963.1 sigma-70 family RNA polymerase sigma factor [Ruminococcus sp.]MDD6635099.1 sigma-70 family RNA polymerase sigma factor [Ruminococcus sp.]MDY3213775.1 sigma-70 family RNA polymerase sigma factor [Ruminococcus sp.]
MKNLLELDFDENVLGELTDEELVKAAQSNKRAEALIISRYLRVILVKSEMYANSVTDSEDLAQEGLLGLMSAISAFDPEKNIKFSTFANVCITNRMKTLISKGKKADSPVDNIEELTDQQDSLLSETPESIYLFKEYYSDLFEKIDSVLTEMESKIFKMYIHDVPYKDIALKLGISEKSVDNAIQRARRKIKNLLKSTDNL